MQRARTAAASANALGVHAVSEKKKSVDYVCVLVFLYVCTDLFAMSDMRVPGAFFFLFPFFFPSRAPSACTNLCVPQRERWNDL